MTKPKVKSQTYRIAPLQSVAALKFLLQQNVFELDAPVDWKTLDWERPEQVNQALNELIKFIETEKLDS